MKIFLLLGSLNAFLGVSLGAFGAHGLKSRITQEMLKVWETAVFYHLVHALALLAVGLLCQSLPESGLLQPAGWSLLTGIILFSGSLYLMVLLNVKSLGMITPFGGVAFLIGWLTMLIAIAKM